VLVHCESVRAVMPVDPEGGGTWIAATDTGLVFALLNDTASCHTCAFPIEDEIAPVSRGLIIPALLDCPSIERVRHRLNARDWSLFRPWRLFVFSAEQMLESWPTWRGMRHQIGALPPRVVRSSSGVDEDRVVRVRASLFDEIVGRPDAALQDEFHRHSWPESLEASVCMERPDTRTVSRTTIEIYRGRIRMDYEALPPVGRRTAVATLELEHQAGAA
jgi:hypothetical protein